MSEGSNQKTKSSNSNNDNNYAHFNAILGPYQVFEDPANPRISINYINNSSLKIGEELWEFHEKIIQHAKRLKENLKTMILLNQNVKMDFYEILAVDLGYPTFPIPDTYKEGIIKYFDEQKINSNLLIPTSKTHSGIRGTSYGMPSGFESARKLLALSFTQQYGFLVKLEEIFITLGGRHALTICFEIAKKICTEKGLNSPIFCAMQPIYPGYKKDFNERENHIHNINLMKLPGYRLTATELRINLRAAMVKANNNNTKLFFIFNNPHNPTGISYNKKELHEFAAVLNEHEFMNVIILQDSAYFWQGNQVALENVAPRLWEQGRLVNIESGTKSLSLAAQRAGCIVTNNIDFSKRIPNEIQKTCVHAPYMTSYAYAYASLNTCSEHYNEMCNFYSNTVDHVYSLLEELGLEMPDKAYNPTKEKNKAFYVLACAKKLFGKPFPKEALHFCPHKKDEIITNDVEAATALFVKTNFGVAPLSFFGANPKSGFLRITCNQNIQRYDAAFNRVKRWFSEIDLIKTKYDHCEQLILATEAWGKLKNQYEELLI